MTWSCGIQQKVVIDRRLINDKRSNVFIFVETVLNPYSAEFLKLY